MSVHHAGDIASLARIDGSASQTVELVPVLPALQGLLSGLRRGQVVAVDQGMTVLLALVAGASSAGSWCALVGVPEIGVEAAAGLGADLDRVVIVTDHGGGQWAPVVGALIGAFDVVLVRPSRRVAGSEARRLEALARRYGSALVVAGEWEGAQTRLRVISSVWSGPRDGRGYLRGRRVHVEVSGRGAGARPRSAWLWLPGADGAVAGADLEVLETPA